MGIGRAVAPNRRARLEDQVREPIQLRHCIWAAVLRDDGQRADDAGEARSTCPLVQAEHQGMARSLYTLLHLQAEPVLMSVQVKIKASRSVKELGAELAGEKKPAKAGVGDALDSDFGSGLQESKALKATLASLGLSTKGSKAELKERLRQSQPGGKFAQTL